MADTNAKHTAAGIYDTISTLKVSGHVYDLSASHVSEDVDLVWSNVSGLAATGSDSSATSGFMTPDQIHEAILADAGKLASFKVVSEVPDPADADDTVIYLVGPETTVTGEDKFEEWVKSGNEMVKIGDTSVDLSDYYTIKETNAYVSGWGETATSSDLPALWEEITGYVDDTVASAVSAVDTSAALWNQAYEAVSGAVTNSADMADEENAEKLAQVGAITGYVKDKIESLSGNYLEKADVYVSAHELVINNL